MTVVARIHISKEKRMILVYTNPGIIKKRKAGNNFISSSPPAKKDILRCSIKNEQMCSRASRRLNITS